MAYRIVDIMFDRKLFTKYSWTGLSRLGQKHPFSGYTLTHKFFQKLVHQHDKTYSDASVKLFFQKKNMHHSLSRSEKPVKRASATKIRGGSTQVPKNKKNKKSASSIPSDEVNNEDEIDDQIRSENDDEKTSLTEALIKKTPPTAENVVEPSSMLLENNTTILKVAAVLPPINNADGDNLVLKNEPIQLSSLNNAADNKLILENEPIKLPPLNNASDNKFVLENEPIKWLPLNNVGVNNLVLGNVPIQFPPPLNNATAEYHLNEPNSLMYGVENTMRKLSGTSVQIFDSKIIQRGNDGSTVGTTLHNFTFDKNANETMHNEEMSDEIKSFIPVQDGAPPSLNDESLYSPSASAHTSDDDDGEFNDAVTLSNVPAREEGASEADGEGDDGSIEDKVLAIALRMPVSIYLYILSYATIHFVFD